MNTLHKFAALTLSAVLSVCLLAGCGSKSDSVTIAVPNDTTNEARHLLHQPHVTELLTQL